MVEDMKNDIEDKRNQGIFDIVNEVQMKGLVDEFMIELGKREDANAQWFVIRYEMAKMDRKTSKVLFFITFQLFVISIMVFTITFWFLSQM